MGIHDSNTEYSEADELGKFLIIVSTLLSDEACHMDDLHNLSQYLSTNVEYVILMCKL